VYLKEGTYHKRLGNTTENLACVFGISGCIFDTACWTGSINTQATCEVKHIAQVLDWSLGNYHGANGLTVDKHINLVEDVGDKLVPHTQQLIIGGRGRMAASMGLDIKQVDQDLAVLRAENERAKVAMTQLQQTYTELGAVWKEADLGLAALTAVKKDLDCKGHTCKTLEAEVKELLGEPQASTCGLTGVQCGRGEGCNVMSQQNLEEEAGCGQTDCRKMKQQAMAKRTADKEAGNGQATGLQKNFLEILVLQSNTHHTVVL